MAIKITDECINCGACEPECPNNAIYEGGAEWRYADGTKVKGEFVARLFIIEQGIEKVIILKPTNFDDKITQIKTAEPENGLCKADLFLKKIDFEHLYDNISLHTF